MAVNILNVFIGFLVYYFGLKWKLHKALARRIAQLTGLPEEPLVNGSVDPNRVESFDPRFDGS